MKIINEDWSYASKLLFKRFVKTVNATFGGKGTHMLLWVLPLYVPRGLVFIVDSLRSNSLRLWRSLTLAPSAPSIIQPWSRAIYLSRHSKCVNMSQKLPCIRAQQLSRTRLNACRRKNYCCNTPVLCSAWKPFDKWMCFFTCSFILFLRHLKCAINYNLCSCSFDRLFSFSFFLCQSRGKLVKLSNSDLNKHYLHMLICRGFPLDYKSLLYESLCFFIASYITTTCSNQWLSSGNVGWSHF